MPDRASDYSWCGVDPLEAGVVRGAWADSLPPVTLPRLGAFADSPNEPAPVLVPVVHPRIRVLAAYWHAGWPHARPYAWLRPAALTPLIAAVETLPDGFGFAIWDAWRDPLLQAVLHATVYADPAVPPGFVTYPDPDPTRCPPHATGGTVDLTLTFRNRPLNLGTTFDAFVPAAATAYFEGGDDDVLARDLRRLLAGALSGAGFVPYPQEWWHWEFGTRTWAAATGGPVLFGHARPPFPY